MVTQANQVAQREDMSNQAKISSLEKIYSKYERKGKSKTYKLPNQAVKRKRGSKVVKVDGRLKKDKRNKKQKEKNHK